MLSTPKTKGRTSKCAQNKEKCKYCNACEHNMWEGEMVSER